jgi:8-oxo-dGTP pyrophosphatase MutT (NUDIX family)
LVDTRLIDAVGGVIPRGATVLAPERATAEALRLAGHQVDHRPLSTAPPDLADAVALLADELSHAGEHADRLLAEAAAALSHGGLLAVSARNRVHAAAVGDPLQGLRGWSADELTRAVGHPGLAIELVCAPGAAAGLRGEPSGAGDPTLDRLPGLLDAAPRTLVVGRWAQEPSARTRAFFASVPRKIAAAAVVCRDDRDRLLVVHDSFKRHWTIPGGVVDADEDPESAAVREAWEEAGVRVTVGGLLGVFAAPLPDRLVFVYAASPPEGGAPHPAPTHAHEIDAAEWVPLKPALDRLAPPIRWQVERCFDAPGGTWRQPW